MKKSLKRSIGIALIFILIMGTSAPALAAAPTQFVSTDMTVELPNSNGLRVTMTGVHSHFGSEEYDNNLFIFFILSSTSTISFSRAVTLYAIDENSARDVNLAANATMRPEESVAYFLLLEGAQTVMYSFVYFNDFFPEIWGTFYPMTDLQVISPATAPPTTPPTTPPPAPTPTATSGISVLLNGSELSFDVPPQTVDGRTLVPLRAIFEALGAEVNWNDSTQTITGTKGDTTVVLPLGSTTPTVNGQTVTIDVPAMVQNGRTLVPLRFVAEALGVVVDWNPSTRTVTITS